MDSFRKMQQWISRNLVFALVGLSLCNLQSVATNNQLDLAFFYPVTRIDENGTRIQEISGLTELVPALAALEHVNTRDGSVVPGVSSLTCPVQLNYTLLDSMLQFPNTLQQYFEYKTTFGKPPDGILGPGRTSTTIPLSFVSTVDQVPIVGYAATGQDLDDTTSHQFFGRTISSDAGAVEAISEFIFEYGYSEVSLLYVDDPYGKSIKDLLFDFTLVRDIEVRLFPFLLDVDQSAENALQALANTKLNVVVAAFFTSNLNEIMTKAANFGLTGTDRLWIFTDSVDTLSGVGSNVVAQALNGSIQIQPSGGLPGHIPFDNFMAQFPTFDFLDDIRLRMAGGAAAVDAFPDPNPPVFNVTRELYESLTPSIFSGYSYDAVLTYAFALEVHCDAYLQNRSLNLISLITSSTFNFTGVTGTVAFNSAGSRTPETAGIIARNLFFGEAPDFTPSTKVVAFFEEGVWNVSEEIRYPPGDATEPPLFTDLPVEELNLVTTDLRIVLFFFSSLVIVVAIVAMYWVIQNRRAAVMSASQPAFLLLIAFGCIIGTASSFLRGWDEVLVPDIVMLNRICNATWWLGSIGMTLVSTGFILKIYRIVRLFSSKQTLKKTVVSLRRLLVIVVIMLSINIALLSAWYIIAPLVYIRVGTQFDSFLQTTESEAYCDPNVDGNSVGYIFISILSVFHLVQLAAGLFLAFKARNIPPDFQEAKWVLLAFFTQVQLTLIGVPILFAIEGSDSDLRFLVYVLLFSLYNLSVLVLLFIPKFYRLRYGAEGVEIFTDSSEKGTRVRIVGSSRSGSSSRDSDRLSKKKKKKPSGEKS